MTQSASDLNSGAHSFRILGSQKFPCFSNFPVSRSRPEKLFDFYWLQLQITCKSGWIAQAEERNLVSKEERSKVTVQKRTKTQGVCSNGARLGLGRLKILSRTPSRATCWGWFLGLQSKRYRGTQRQFSEKYLFGRRFEIQNFRNNCCKISCLPASPRIFEHLKNCIIANF